MKLSGLKDFNIYFNPIKNIILFCVKRNRLVDVEYSNIYIYIYIFKGRKFSTKKYRSNLQRNLNI